MSGRRTFRTKVEGFGLAKRVWECTNCHLTHSSKPKLCGCGGRSFLYFASESEFFRYRQLQMLLSVGDISDLECQPSYPLTAGGNKIGVYRADFCYLRRGKKVVEDVKGSTNKKHLDPLSAWKIKHVEAEYGISVRLVKP